MSCRYCISISLIVAWLCLVAMTPAQQAQFQDIAAQLRCLTCPNETVAESASPMALDVKDYIRTRLADHATTDQIIAELATRYSEAVRYQPVMRTHTVLLWITPAICLACGLLFVARLLMKRRVS